jgi:hypothetical protein
MNREILPQYYQEIDAAFKILYELELDIRADDMSIVQYTPEQRASSNAYQRAIWIKYDVNPNKNLNDYTGRDFALKFFISNGNTTSYEYWMRFTKDQRKSFQQRLEEITSCDDFLNKRINPDCQTRCDKCKKHIVNLMECPICKYGRYCSTKCRSSDKNRHHAVCNFFLRYTDITRR